MNRKFLQRIIIPASMALALAACQTIDPYTGEQKTSNATKGAAMGAAAGAISGDNNRERRASSVSSYLKSRGVVAQRIAAFGVGSDYPVASNGTSHGRTLNRRVEIALSPLTA